ncbi:ATP-dependent Clp protease adaptor ClpS [Lacinutrix mariniflava]|uniref:ATP-dependent Clp protease adaptor ClpS n=1 Tax=Lacinutrix mariniflava TaxID=342955 RepID=UPI0006E308F9|nr:ATP-dependent Clp protease adaptor ClpS [Lacinutrix mariniflava]
MNTQEKVLEQTDTITETKKNNEIVVYNDDYNTFDHVIETLIKACKHTPEQAEQCTILVHYKGQCTVKTGELKDLKPICSSILEAGIDAEII